MSTEAEDLAELSEALPHLPDEINALGQAAHDLQESSLHLRDRLAEARQEVALALTHARESVTGVTTLVESLDQGLESALGAADQAWAEAQERMEEGEQALVDAAGHVDGAGDGLADVLADATAAIGQASDGGEAAVDRVESVARDGSERVRAAAAAVGAAAARFRAVLDSARAEVDEAGEALLDRFHIFRDNAEFDAKTLIDHLVERSDDYLAHLERLAADLPSRTDPVMVAFAGRITDEVVHPASVGGEAFRIEVEGLGGHADVRRQALLETREELAQAVDALNTTAEPLPAVMQEIQGAMQRLSQQ